MSHCGRENKKKFHDSFKFRLERRTTSFLGRLNPAHLVTQVSLESSAVCCRSTPLGPRFASFWLSSRLGSRIHSVSDISNASFAAIISFTVPVRNVGHDRNLRKVALAYPFLLVGLHSSTLLPRSLFPTDANP